MESYNPHGDKSVNVIFGHLAFFFAFFGAVFFFATRCCGGLFETTPAARSKRSHASV
jgi:hypothetical protein